MMLVVLKAALLLYCSAVLGYWLGTIISRAIDLFENGL